MSEEQQVAQVSLWQILFWIGTLVIASWGAVLSAYNSFFKDRLKLKVHVIRQESPIKYNLMIENKSSNKSTIITSYGFYMEGSQERLKVRSDARDMISGIPKLLRASEHISIMFLYNDISSALHEKGIKTNTKLIGFYKDEHGKEHKSKPFEFRSLTL